MNVRWFPLLLLPIALWGTGCGSPVAEFRRYETFAHQQDDKMRSEVKQQVDTVLVALYGTPDEPRLPPANPEADISTILDLNKLKVAAGPVYSKEQQGKQFGLYREHCVHCHGITGDGNGPTAAFLNPYPRDYRPGKYKFKSTPIGQRPTHDDLKRVLVNGIQGTAMPSFKLLSDFEVDALVHYVKYLTIRGETERSLYLQAAQLSEKENLINTKEKLSEDQLAFLKTTVEDVVKRWIEAPKLSMEIPARKEMTSAELTSSRLAGRELFYSSKANCFSCHGGTALGDGQMTDYDSWVGEFIGKKPDAKIEQEYMALGMPKPRNILPRNLRLGVYRGGMRPIDLYWRVRNGIEGSPMPGNDKLKPDEIWDIVNYVQSLPYEKMSDPRQHEPTDLRERM